MCSEHRHKINNSFWYRYAVFYFESDICSLLFSHKDFSLVLQFRYRLHTSRLHVIRECTVVMVSACVRPQIMCHTQALTITRYPILKVLNSEV